MFKPFVLLVCLLFFVHLSGIAQQSNSIESGVSEQLANKRSSLISDIQYQLHFNVPAALSEEITGREKLTFRLKAAGDALQIDFKQAADQVSKIMVNDKKIDVDLQSEHLIVAAQYLKKGENTVEIDFIAGSSSLNRNRDYLYALFVPDHARSAFPCFDQPNLKASFLLSLTIPVGWKALANGELKHISADGGAQTYQFANSDLLPTYLFSFTAGKYVSVNQKVRGRNQEFLHRETDSVKVKLSIDSIFKAHGDAINFLEEWTTIPFPFQKIGFVAIPDFQFGGMEHPGVVQYKASSLFLDGGATKDQLIGRLNLISHETAHMWFGDLVTMNWFNDVWMKEVFANFMADKVTEKLMGKETFDLKFLQDHYPAAYAVDRTLGANAIRQQLDNLQDAGSMYGNIIYHKAPIMMRQLELLMGKDKFQQGIRAYLKKYAYSNATWNDLIGILSTNTEKDLNKWNKVWVNSPGRPVFDYTISYQGKKIDKLTIQQHPEFGQQAVWPQVFTVTLVYADRSENIKVNMNAAKIEIKEATNLPRPKYLVFNTDALGYGLFPIDSNSIADLPNLKTPLERASAYINLYENMLSGRSLMPASLLELLITGIQKEKNEMNLRLLGGYIGNIYWSFMRPAERISLAPRLEQVLWTRMQMEPDANNKKILFKTFQDVYSTSAAGKNLGQIWYTQQSPAGVKLTEDDYTSLAFTLALKSDTISNFLTVQKDRIANVERKNRIAFLMPALSTDVAERNRFFESLADRKNREKEAWVSTALAYLNHPLTHETSIAYLPKSLELVAEIQRTGDIFFPQSWLGATFNGYQSKEAYQIVTDFLAKHPNYNPKLKGKILQATDNLYRAQKILSK